MWITVLLLGMAGSIVSTLIGFGAGMVLTISLALMVSPLAALSVASVALLSGSVHRVLLFRHALRAGDASRWAVGIAVGSVFGGMLVHHLPEWLLRAAFVVAAVAALLPRPTLDGGWKPRWQLLLPAGGAIGFIGAGTAGVGPLASSTLLGTGHFGERYIALMSVTGIALNAGRIVGYGSSGVLELAWLWTSISAALGLLLGNLVGRRIRHRLPAFRLSQLERAVPWLCLALALFGLAT